MTPAEKLARSKSAKKKIAASRPTRNRPWRTILREMREQHGLCQRDVAGHVGISLANYNVIERGANASLIVARRLATFYGATVEELWPELLTEEKGTAT